MPQDSFKISEAYIQQSKMRGYATVLLYLALWQVYLIFTTWENSLIPSTVTLVCVSLAIVLGIPFILSASHAERKKLQELQVNLTPLGIVRLGKNSIENMDYEEITAATFYQDNTGRIKQIDLQSEKEGFTLIHLHGMNQLAGLIKNRLPNPNIVQLKTRRFVGSELILVVGGLTVIILLLAWLTSYIIPGAFSGIVSVSLILAALYQWKAGRLIPSLWAGKNDNRSAAASLLLLAVISLLSGGMGFWFGPCSITDRFLMGSGCIAAYDEVDSVAFVPAGTLLLERKLGNVHARLAPGWPWSDQAILPHPDYVWGYFVSPDGSLFVSSISGEPDGTQLQFWNLAERRLIYQILTDDMPSDMDGVVFSADSRFVALATRTHVEVWDVTTWQQIGRAEGGWAAAFHPDGRSIVTPAPEGGVRWWNVADGTEVGQLTMPASGFNAGIAVNGLAFSPDGRWLAANIGERGMVVWQLPAGTLHHSWQLPTRTTATAAFSPDGNLLAAGFEDAIEEEEGYLRLWQVEDFQEWDTIAAKGTFNHFNTVNAVRFSADGRRLALNVYSGGVLIFDVDKLGPGPFDR